MNFIESLGFSREKLKKLLVIMKLTIMLMVLFTIQLEASVYSQNTRLDLNMKNQPLINVLKEIRNNSEFTFVYDQEDVEEVQNIKAKYKNATVEEILDGCLKNTNLTYQVIDNVVIFKQAPPAPKQNNIQQPDTTTIRGIVADEGGIPLVGVTVLLKGTTIGTITDVNGKYAITVPENATLVFSFVGTKTEEISVATGQTEINMVMHAESTLLGEVMVIATGYQKIKAEQSTGSIAAIEMKEFDSRVYTDDFLSGLQNKIPGLLINNDIEFEGNSLFQIRGLSTISGNKEPLIVIDGFPTELSLDMINPNEIASVTVLKDAAAATIYGVRASNGVIIIERKQAKPGEIKVNFRSTIGFKPKEDYERYRWDEDASNISIDYEQSTFNIPYMWNLITNPYAGAYYNVNAIEYILAQEAANVITTEQAEQLYQEMGSYNNSKDYSDLFLRTAVTQSYNLNLSGGDENALYYITANYTDSELSKIKNGNSNFSLSGRTALNFSERLSMELTTDFQEINTSSVPIPNINDVFSYERFQDEDGNPLSIYSGSYANPYYNEYLMSIGLLDNRYYPLVDMNEISDKTHTLNNRITANLRLDLGKGFKFNLGGVYETSRTDIRHLASENSSEVHQLVNRYASNGADGITFNIPHADFLTQGKSSRDSYTIRAQMNFDNKIRENHSLNVILGGEMRNVLDKSSTEAYFGYNDKTLSSLPVDYATFFSSAFAPTYAGSNSTLSYNGLFNHGYNDNRYISIYSNLVYAYKGKYSVTGSMRIDQSNLFGTDPKYRYKPLWSVGAAWNIHKEDFMQNFDWLKNLKLRAAYGFNGNVAKNSLPQVIAEAGYNYFTPSSNYDEILSLYSYANSGLRWEQTENFNIGLDYSIFKNITGNIDYYIRKSTDLMATNQIDATKGGTSALVNQASIRNSGLEISLHADWITRKQFNWNTGLIFSYNTSKVLSVYNELTEASASKDYVSGSYTNYIEDYAIGAIFNYRYAGLNSEGVPMIYDKDGNIKGFLEDNAGKLDVDYVGSSIPKVNIGLSNRLDIGNFYFYSMINFYGGFKVRVPVPFVGDTRPLEGADNYWKEEGDEADPDMLPILNSNHYTNLGYTDKYTVSGAYLTLGELTFAYSFRDSEILKKTGISNFEMRLQASNLYTVGFNDYDYSLATGSYAKPYMTPTYTFGLYVNF